MNSVHDNSCNVCHIFPMVGRRYKCTMCPDYDVCEKCFSKMPRLHPGHYWIELTRPMRNVWDDTYTNAIRRQTTHAGISCNACGTGPLVGVRYKCLHPDCPDYDLCPTCEALPIPVHPISHPLVKMRLPQRSYRGLNDLFAMMYSRNHFVQSRVVDDQRDYRMRELTTEVMELKILLAASLDAQGSVSGPVPGPSSAPAPAPVPPPARGQTMNSVSDAVPPPAYTPI